MSGVSQVSPDSQESQDSPDLKGRSGPEERRVAMDLKDQSVQKESEGLLVCQDFQEHQDFPVCPGRTDLQAREECRVVMAQRVREVYQAVQGSLDSRVGRVHLVCQDKRETRVMSSPPTVLERKERWDCLDCPEFLEVQEPRVHKVHSALQDPEATRVVQVLQVLLDQRETWD